MPDVTPAEFRPTDEIVHVSLSSNGIAGGAVNVSANGIRLFQTTHPIRIVGMTVTTGSGTMTAGNTIQAAYGVNSGAGAALGATAGTALTVAAGLAAATVNTIPIESVSASDTTPRDVIPAGSFVGFNIPAVALNAMTLISATVRYRDA